MPSELMVRVRELGIRKIINDTRPIRLVTSYGVLFVNSNAFKMLDRWLKGNIIANAPLARDDLYAWIRIWNGSQWLYRVATDAYVDFDPGEIIEYVKSLIPKYEPIRLGALHGSGVFMREGARYAEGVWGIEEDGVVKGIWVRTGDDGYTAIKVRPFLGFPQEISAIILPNRVSRRLHVRVETIRDRVKIDVDASLATLRTFNIKHLMDYPVPFTVINYLAKRVYDLPGHWLEAKAKYGENAYALAIALGMCLTRANVDRREKIAKYLVWLTDEPLNFINAFSQAETAPREDTN